MKRVLALVLVMASLGTVAGVAQTPSPTGPEAPPPHHHHPDMGMGMGPMMPPPMFWRNPEVAAKLNLTDAQRTQLEKIFADHRDTFRSNHHQLREAMQAVKAALDADPVKVDDYNANVAKVEALHAQIGKEFAAMVLSVRQVLTADQWKTLEQMHHEHMEQFKGHWDKFGSGNQPPAPPEPPE